MTLPALPNDPAAREKYILERASYDDIDWTIVSVPIAGKVVEFAVMNDALKIDGVRVVAGARVAQLVADKLGLSLPTPKMVSLAWRSASVKLRPHPRPISRSSADVVAHSEAVDAELAGRVGLVDNAGKWWVLVNALALKHGKAANYGWLVPPGEVVAGKWKGIPLDRGVLAELVIQSIGTAHGPEQDDYSQTIRLVESDVRVDGETRSLADVLADPELCGALSHEGPLLVTRQPGVPISGEETIRALAKTEPPPPSTQIGAINVQGGNVQIGDHNQMKVSYPPPAPATTTPPPAGDVDGVPFLQAAHFTPANRTTVDCVVIHTAECGETPGAATNLMKWCAGPNAPQASWHYAVDSTGVTQSVREKHVAWHAPGMNGKGIGVEHAGRAAQNAAGWSDAYSLAVLDYSARLVAGVCRRWGIPVVRLSPADLLAGKRGITGHVDVTMAFKKSTHTDPGTAWPWESYLAAVQRYVDASA